MDSEQTAEFALTYLSPEKKEIRKQEKIWHMRSDRMKHAIRMAPLNDLIASRVPPETRNKKNVKTRTKRMIKNATTTLTTPKYKAKYRPNFKNSPLFRKAPTTKVKPSTLFKFQLHNAKKEKSKCVQIDSLDANGEADFNEKDKLNKRRRKEKKRKAKKLKNAFGF